MRHDDEWLEAAQTAQRIKRPVSTLYYWRSRHEGPPCVRIGKRLLYRASDVDRWVEEQLTAQSSGGAH